MIGGSLIDRRPQIVIIGGPNGAGKSTAARGLLQDLLDLGEFVNADTIAAGLAGLAPERGASRRGGSCWRGYTSLPRPE